MFISIYYIYNAYTCVQVLLCKALTRLNLHVHLFGARESRSARNNPNNPTNPNNLSNVKRQQSLSLSFNNPNNPNNPLIRSPIPLIVKQLKYHLAMFSDPSPTGRGEQRKSERYLTKARLMLLRLAVTYMGQPHTSLMALSAYSPVHVAHQLFTQDPVCTPTLSLSLSPRSPSLKHTRISPLYDSNSYTK